MCGLFPCIPILGVFFFNKKVSWDEGSDFTICLCPGSLHLSVGPAIYTFCMPSFSFWVFVFLDFTWKKQLLFLVQDRIVSILRLLGSNNSTKQRQTGLKFWPQVVLTVVQMLFKTFWKNSIEFLQGQDVPKV